MSGDLLPLLFLPPSLFLPLLSPPPPPSSLAGSVQSAPSSLSTLPSSSPSLPAKGETPPYVRMYFVDM